MKRAAIAAPTRKLSADMNAVKSEVPQKRLKPCFANQRLQVPKLAKGSSRPSLLKWPRKDRGAQPEAKYVETRAGCDGAHHEDRGRVMRIEGSNSSRFYHEVGVFAGIMADVVAAAGISVKLKVDKGGGWDDSCYLWIASLE